MTDFLQPGVDNDTIKDFADNKGDLAKHKFGGIYKLEILMRAMLNAGHRPALKRARSPNPTRAQQLNWTGINLADNAKEEDWGKEQNESQYR